MTFIVSLLFTAVETPYILSDRIVFIQLLIKDCFIRGRAPSCIITISELVSFNALYTDSFREFPPITSFNGLLIFLLSIICCTTLNSSFFTTKIISFI